MVFRESASTLAPLLLALPPPARAVCMVFPRKLLRARAFARDSAQPAAAALYLVGLLIGTIVNVCTTDDFAKTGSDRDSHDQNPDEILLRIVR